MQVVPCHLCSICGRRRSGGYHRKHPIVPGRPPILAPCNKCTRSSQRERDRRERARELREDNTITIRIDDSSSRGRIRERSSEVLYVRRHSSPSPKRIVVRRRSRAHLGVRALQEDGRRATRRSIEVRYASPSPPPVIRVRHRSDEVYESTPLAPPPPPPPAPKHRFVEVSPSPPRTRRTTRVEYREESVERRPMTDYRPRSLSPVRVPQREHRRSDDAEARLASHPAPFRTVMPDHRTYLRESEASISTDSPTRGLSPRRGILRNSEMAHETAQRRQMQESYDSMLPEVGHNRVQFVAESSRRDERRDERRETDSDRDRRRRFVDGHTSSGEDFNYRHRERHYVDTPPPAPPSPPIQDFNRMRIRTSSPPSRGYEHETRVQYSSPPSSRGFDRETRIRHVSPDGRFIEARTRHTSPRRDRTSRLRGISPDIEYQEITRTRGVERAPSPVDYSDHTESGSEESPREDLQVHRYNEYDEHQRVIGVVEQRRTRFLPKTPAETPRYSSAPPVQNYRVV
ncbi:hypothetical protein P280DRAFT_232265 [Massarina eburnea CBS 473.64]|uniref:Uncharacterized protein n=1 Tax=Massarina eburnea CBS 473.64 TaxID=1395130 RepID=A0A6A6RKV9_9PLEO|nr:hypothetical protein P280DRAFT_232265 [Massarina eburnea CBS 473.64]